LNIGEGWIGESHGLSLLRWGRAAFKTQAKEARPYIPSTAAQDRARHAVPLRWRGKPRPYSRFVQ
jgi:hypothetical protein